MCEKAMEVKFRKNIGMEAQIMNKKDDESCVGKYHFSKLSEELVDVENDHSVDWDNVNRDKDNNDYQFLTLNFDSVDSLERVISGLIHLRNEMVKRNDEIKEYKKDN